PDAPVPSRCGSAYRAANGLVDGMELVIGRDLLDDVRTVGLEHDEVADQVKEPGLREDALDEHFQGTQIGGGNLVALDRLPGHEPFKGGVQRAGTCLKPVRYSKKLVEDKEARNLVLVGLELLKGPFDRGVFIAQILQFHPREW